MVPVLSMFLTCSHPFPEALAPSGKQWPTEEAFCGRSVHHLLIIEEDGEERGTFPVDQLKAPVFEVLPGPTFNNQDENTIAEALCIPFGVPLEPLNVLGGAQQTSSDGVVKPSPNLCRLRGREVNV